MSAPFRTISFVPEPISVLDCFELRCWARAYLFAACEFDLQTAVDVLQRDAVRDGLVDELGQDEVQAIMVEAFAKVLP
jgi:hypothetical protein